MGGGNPLHPLEMAPTHASSLLIEDYSELCLFEKPNLLWGKESQACACVCALQTRWEKRLTYGKSQEELEEVKMTLHNLSHFQIDVK